MRTSIFPAVLLLVILLAGCTQAAAPQPTPAAPASSVPGAAAVAGITGSQASELAPLARQAAMGEPSTLQANLMTPPIGGQRLSGEVIFTVTMVERNPELTQQGRAVAGGSGVGFHQPRNGIFYVVHYQVENKTGASFQPDGYVHSAFKLADDQGRQWSLANFLSHGFPVAYAFGVPHQRKDAREWIGPDQVVESTMAFDVDREASGLRLRSEALGIEITLQE